MVPLSDTSEATVAERSLQRMSARGSPRRGSNVRSRSRCGLRVSPHHAACAPSLSERWSLPEHEGWRLLKPGFERAYRRGRRAHARARREGTPEALHEWRKEVKYLLYQLQLIEPAWRASERLLARRLDRLADLLGEDHDLAVVRAMVTEPAVIRLVDRRRAVLQRQAFAVGRVVDEPRPAARLRSLRDAWDDWRR